MIVVLALVSCAPQPAFHRAAVSGWEILPPIPDPVGFGGMFAAVLDGQLIAGGGSQFPENPIWKQGRKTYSDKIYALSGTNKTWKLLDARLPEKCGHFAFAASENAIYIAGGLTAEGFTKSCHVLRMEKGGIITQKLPDFPVPVCYALGALIGSRFVVVGGQNDPADKKASAQTWALDIDKADAAWERMADMPGAGVFVSSCGADSSSMYVFGGLTFDSDGKTAPSKAVCAYDVASDKWRRLADLAEPRVAAVTPCPRLANGDFMVIGGYARLYPGVTREYPGFKAQTFLYNPGKQSCAPGPMLPESPATDRDLSTDSAPMPMIAAPCVIWKNLVVCVSGEVRISTRTPTVLAWPIADK